MHTITTTCLLVMLLRTLAVIYLLGDQREGDRGDCQNSEAEEAEVELEDEEE